MTNTVKSLTPKLGIKASKSPIGDEDTPTTITVIDMGRTVIGNKKIIFADLVLGGSSRNWPEYGMALTPQNFGLVAIDAIMFNGGQAQYAWAANVLDAYVCGTAGATNVLVKADGALIDETVRCMVIGYGMQP